MARAPMGRAWLLAPLVLLPALFQSLLYKDALLDDPFITFRYARHLVEGLGLVWNAGERPVEGFTSFGWTMLAALGMKLGVHPLAFTKWLGLASVVAIVLLPLTPLNRLQTRPATRLLTALMLSLCPLLAFYGQSGMEHILFALGVFAALLAYLRTLDEAGPWRLVTGALVGLCGLVRPEGLGVLGILVLFEIYRSVRDRDPNKLKWLGQLAGPFLLLWAPLFAWRLSYFGYPFPNTYYAKHSGGGLMQVLTGLQYTLGGLSLYGVAPLAFIATTWLAVRERLADDRLRCLAWFLAAYVGYITLVGGDDTSAFPSVRFFVPVVPPLYLLAATMLERLTEHGRRLLVGGVALAGLTFLGCYSDAVRFKAASAPDWHALFTVRSTPYQAPELSRWIRSHTAPTDLVALPWAGMVAYYSDRPVLDTLGLNDLHIAHLPKRQRGIDVKMDPAYVLERKPKLIFINVDRGVALGTETFEQGGGWKLGDKELLEALKHRSDYRLVTDAPTNVVVYERMG